MSNQDLGQPKLLIDREDYAVRPQYANYFEVNSSQAELRFVFGQAPCRPLTERETMEGVVGVPLMAEVILPLVIAEELLQVLHQHIQAAGQGGLLPARKQP